MNQAIHAYYSRADIVLVDRNASGARLETRVPAVYSSYPKAPSDLTNRLINHHRALGNIAGLSIVGDWHRLDWKDRDTRMAGTALDGLLAKAGAVHYEADVNPIRRYMSDNPVSIAKPRRAYIDIETDSRVSFKLALEGAARVLCWAMVDEAGNRQSALLEHDTDAAERILLKKFWRTCQPFDQLIAWNGDYFDFSILKMRSELLGLKPNHRQYLYLDHLLVYKRQSIGSSESGEDRTSYKLESVAQVTLGEGKHDVDGSKTWEYWSAGWDSRIKLLHYCLQDTDLLRRIEEKTGYIEMSHAIAEVCNLFPDSHALKPTVQIDGYMLRIGAQRNIHFPTRYFDEQIERKKFKGAFVKDPTARGITKSVHVADFASLYPSIIVSFNMSPETKRTGNEPAGTPFCKLPTTGVEYRTDVSGILSGALKDVMGLRKSWNDAQATFPPETPQWHDAKRRSAANKIAANSFYGVMGTPYSRFFDLEIAESTSTTGAWLINKTIEAAEARGMQAIYGDSVTASRIVVCKDPSDHIQMITISELWSLSTSQYNDREKEFGLLKGWTALTHLGWKPIKTIIRHVCSKPIHRITTKHGQVEVTEDHSIMVDNKSVSPIEFIV